LGLWNPDGIYGGIAAFAGYAIAVAPMLLLLGSRLAAAWSRAAVFALFLLVVVTGVFTLERIVWWALALQAVIALILLWRRNFSAAGGDLVGVHNGCGLAGCRDFPGSEQVRFGTSSVGAVAEDIRLGQLGPVLDRIAESPASGAGFGRGVLSKAHRDLIPESNTQFWHAHNYS